MPFKPGDICITDIQYTADCYVITEPVPGDLGSYYVLSTRNRTIYIVAEKVLHKIGEVLPPLGVLAVQDLLMKKPDPPALDSPEYLKGKLRAEREEIEDRLENRARWTILADAKPGSFLGIHNRKGTEVVTFHHVLERGKRYVFLAADKKGKLCQYTLSCLCLGQAEH